MKMNYDCVRSVMLALEENITINDDMCLIPISIDKLIELLPRYAPKDVLYTVEKLKEAEYIKASMQRAGMTYIDGIVTDITYSGHEFTEKIRDGKIWRGIKNTLEKVGAITLPLISYAAQEIISVKIRGGE